MRRMILLSLVVLSLAIILHPALGANENVRNLVSEIQISYQPYLQMKATWKVGESHRTTISRDNDRGSYADDSLAKGMHAEHIASEGSGYLNAVRGTGTGYVDVSSRIKNEKGQFLADFGSISPSPSFGILMGKWIPDILNKLQDVSLSQVMLENRPVQLLKGKLANMGELSLWFDAGDRVVCKIDYVAEFPLRDISWDGVSDAVKTSIPKQVVHATYSMEDFSLVDSVLAPHKVVEETTYPDYPNTLPKIDIHGKAILDIDNNGKVRILPGGHNKTVSILEGIQFGKPSDGDLAITISIPNGTRVVMEDAKHLDFKWRDGEIVAVTDEAAKALGMKRGQR